VRKLQDVKVEINPMPLSPLSKCYDQRLTKEEAKVTGEAGVQAQIQVDLTPEKKESAETGTMT
jgi:hypothetical protein